MVLLLSGLWLAFGAVLLWLLAFQPANVSLQWRTETELDTIGFNVYRADSRDGSYQQLNEQMIPSAGDATSGADYEFVDRGRDRGRTYYYRLEDIQSDGARQFHDPLVIQVGRPAWWALAMAGLALLIGVGILAFAIRS